MRLLILGEGPTDLGHVRPDGTLELEGALPTLVRRLLAEQVADLEFRCEQFGKDRLFPRGRQIGRSKYGYANKLRGLLALKEGREADAIVAVVDRDGERNTDRIGELNAGRDELQKANKPCAVGVAIEMIEAWLLADEKALCGALGDPDIERQPDPEG
jgi:hypothetical protein